MNERGWIGMALAACAGLGVGCEQYSVPASWYAQFAAAMGDSGLSTGSASANSSANGSSGSSASAGSTVCDILSGGGTPCVAAHSTTRVLVNGYTGPLYQVCLGAAQAGPPPGTCANGMTKDIFSVGGVADSAAQDAFCSGGTCSIIIIYDQTSNHNDLAPTPAGGGNKASADDPANATALKKRLNGHTVYGVLVKPGIGYRAGCTNGGGCYVPVAKGTATGDEPETEYMVTSQNHLIDLCCFDYGNAETDSHDDGNGTMEAVYFGGGVVWGTGTPGGHQNGPWVMGDLENGVYAGWENGSDQAISTNISLKFDFVTAVVVGDVSTANNGMGRYALYGGDATSGQLTTLYDGVRPQKSGYTPPTKQGSIILGTGGDNSDSGGGEWYEGVMASGVASVPTLQAIQANIVAAGYGK